MKVHSTFDASQQPMAVKERKPFWTNERIEAAVMIGLAAIAAGTIYYLSAEAQEMRDLQTRLGTKCEKMIEGPANAVSSMAEAARKAAKEGLYGTDIQQIETVPLKPCTVGMAEFNRYSEGQYCQNIKDSFLSTVHLLQSNPDYQSYLRKMSEMNCPYPLKESEFTDLKALPLEKFNQVLEPSAILTSRPMTLLQEMRYDLHRCMREAKITQCGNLPFYSATSPNGMLYQAAKTRDWETVQVLRQPKYVSDIRGIAVTNAVRSCVKYMPVVDGYRNDLPAQADQIKTLEELLSFPQIQSMRDYEKRDLANLIKSSFFPEVQKLANRITQDKS